MVGIDLAVGVLSGLITELIKDYSVKLEQSAADGITAYSASRSISQKMAAKISAACRKLPEEELVGLAKFLGDETLVSELTNLVLSGSFDAEPINKLIVSSPHSEGLQPEFLSKIATSLQNAFDECIADEDFAAHYSMLNQLRSVRMQTSQIDTTSKEIKKTLDDAVIPELQKIQTLKDSVDALTAQVVKQGAQSNPMGEPGRFLYGNSSPISTEELTERLESQYKVRFEAATEALKNARLVEALKTYESIYSEVEQLDDATSKRARFRAANGIALCYWHSSKISESKAWFSRAVEHGGEDKMVRRNRMLVRFLDNDLAGAAVLAEALLLEYPHFFDAASTLANIAVLAGDYEKALQCYETHSDGSLDFVLALAGENLKRERFDAALGYGEAAFRLAPSSWGARIALVDAKAIPVVRKRNEIQTEEVITSSDRQVLDEALKVYGEYFSSGFSPQAFEVRERLVTNYSSYASIASRWDEAKAVLAAFLVDYPQSIPALQNLFIVWVKTRDTDSAIEVAERLLGVSPSVESAIRLLEILGQADRSSETLERYDELKSQYPELEQSSRVQAVVGGCLYKVGEVERAFETFEKARGMKPLWVPGLLVRASCLEKEKRDSEAELDLQEAVKDEGETWRWVAQYEYGMFLARHERWPEAVQYFELCGGKDVGTTILPEYLVALSQLGKWKECIDVLEKRDASSKYNEALTQLEANCRLRVFDYKGAETCFRKLTDRDGQHVQHWANLAEVLYRLDRIDAAIATLRRAIAINSQAYELWLNLSRMYLLRGKRKEAVDAAAKASSLAPQADSVHRWIFNVGQLALKGSELPPTFVPLLQKSIDYLSKQPSSGLTRVELKNCVKQVKKSLSRLRKSVKRTATIYNSSPMPLHLLRHPLGRSLFELWLFAVAGAEGMRVRMSRGNQQDQEAENGVVTGSSDVVVEMTGLLTLSLVHQLDLLPRMFRQVLIPTTVFEEIKKASESFVFEANTEGTFVLQGGRPVFLENSSTVRENQKALLGRILDFCKSSVVELVPLPPSTLDDAVFDQRRDLLGLQGIHAAVVAKQRSAILFSDDWLYRTLFFNEEAVRGTCSQAILRMAGIKGYINHGDYQAAILLLISSNYIFVADDVGTMVALIENGWGPEDKMSRRILDRFASGEVSRFPAASFLGNFLGICRRMLIGKDQQVWLEAIVKAFANGNPDETDVAQFCLGAIISLSSTPSLFFDIVLRMRQWKWLDPRIRKRMRFFTYLFVQSSASYVNTVNGLQIDPQSWRAAWEADVRIRRAFRSLLF